MGYLETLLLATLGIAGLMIREVIKLECEIRQIEKETREKMKDNESL